MAIQKNEAGSSEVKGSRMHKGRKTINYLQKLKDGPRLGGRASAEQDFAGLESGDDEDFLA